MTGDSRSGPPDAPDAPDAPETPARPSRPGPPSVPGRRPSLWPRPGQRDLTPALLGDGRVSATEIRAREWAYVLAARGIPHVLRREGSGWRLYVPRRRAEEGLAEIRAYAAERSDVVLYDPEAGPDRPPVGLAVLAWMGVVTGFWGFLLGGAPFFGRHVRWRDIGAGDSAAMLAGQWWRAVTSLCLHADPAHLFGNAACGTLFLVLLCRETGVGLGFALALGAGVAGNVAKVLIQGPGLHFLGASTAVFGALGVLGGVRLVSRLNPLSAKRAATAGAALMLLAMLGAGPGEDGGPGAGGAVDLAGHLFGFLSGALLGLGAGWLVDRRGRPGGAAQALFGALAAAVALGALGLALAFGQG